MTALLEARGIRKKFAGITALDNREAESFFVEGVKAR